MAKRIGQPLEVEYGLNHDTRQWEWTLTEDLIFKVGSPDSNRVLTIEAGATTDFASVPSFLRWIIPNWDKGHAVPTTLHDALYRGTDFTYMEHLPDGTKKQLDRPTRSEADSIYREALSEVAKFGDGFSWLQRLLAYLAVRICGWSGYKRVPADGQEGGGAAA